MLWWFVMCLFNVASKITSVTLEFDKRGSKTLTFDSRLPLRNQLENFCIDDYALCSAASYESFEHFLFDLSLQFSSRGIPALTDAATGFRKLSLGPASVPPDWISVPKRWRGSQIEAGEFDLVLTTSFDKIPSSEVPATLTLLRNMLKPGGVLELWVQDFDKLMWVVHHKQCLHRSSADSHTRVLFNTFNFFNQRTFDAGVKSAYTEASLTSLLLNAGFEGVFRIHHHRAAFHPDIFSPAGNVLLGLRVHKPLSGDSTSDKCTNNLAVNGATIPDPSPIGPPIVNDSQDRKAVCMKQASLLPNPANISGGWHSRHTFLDRVFHDLASTAKPPVRMFVETGTFKGDTVDRMKTLYKYVFSIELQQELYQAAKQRFRDDKRVHILQGESHQQLPRILKQLPEAAVFWLDGHYSGQFQGVQTAKGSIENPVVEELELILAHRQKTGLKHIILIDDARQYRGKGFCLDDAQRNIMKSREFCDYPSLDELLDLVCRFNPQYYFMVHQDYIIIHES